MNRYNVAFVCLLLVLSLVLPGNVVAQGSAPPAPTNLTVKTLNGPSGELSVQLDWDAPMGPYMFRIYRSLGSSTSFIQVGFPTFNHRYIDNAVQGGDTYNYFVRSIDQSMTESSPSNTVSISLPGVPTSGTLTGTVTDEVTQAPVPNVQMQLFRVGSSPQWWIQVLTDQNGKYQALLDPGMYTVHAIPPYPSGYKEEWYENAADEQSAKQVEVTAGGIATADMALGKKAPAVSGKISGTVIDDVTTLPIAGVRIVFYPKSNVMTFLRTALTSDAGYYEAVVDTGVYLIRAVPPIPSMSKPGYESEWYDNQKDAMSATPVHVSEGASFTANFGLKPIAPPTLASIEGTVKDASGNPLASAQVVFMRTVQDMNFISSIPDMTPGIGSESIIVDGIGNCRGAMWKGLTDANGHYKASVVAGLKYIGVASKPGFVPEYYDNKTNPMAADIISVDNDVTGIDFSLDAMPSLQNSISGMVREESGNGVPSRVVAIPVEPGTLHLFARFAHTDGNGYYTIGGLSAGKYLVLAVPFSNYAPAFYKKDQYGVIHWKDADQIDVAGNVTDITIGVVPIQCAGFSRLKGRALASNGNPLEGVSVYVTSSLGQIVGYGLTDAGGSYSVDGLPTGSLSVQADLQGYTSNSATVNIPAGAELSQDVILTAGPAVGVETGIEVPREYGLSQNYPNPFNPSTRITFAMPAGGTASLAVFNVLGQKVASLLNSQMPAGIHTVTWNGMDGSGRHLASGLYLYRLTVTAENGQEAFTSVRKMLLTK